MTRKNSNLQRWVTGLVLAGALLAVLICGSLEVLTVLIVLVIVGGVWEYNRIVFGPGFLKEKTVGIIFSLLIPGAFYLGDFQMLAAAVAFMLMAVFIIFLWRVNERTLDIMTVAKVVLGVVYISFLTSHFILLRKLEEGIYWIILVLVIAIIGDTVALYVGKSLGKRKLIPVVSPGKTVEGTIGLIVGATLAACVYGFFFLPGISVVHFVIIGFAGSIIGQLGDLCESAIKRHYGRKDASSLLPGHGGLLDRLDSLIFVAPFAYYYRVFVIG
ncbi:MAG TPA: phosphatidate cytidylyltransferase [Smithellaceae bacterium]|nr:phosphatidate cytidylyltransferase [Smithellaceae bacterium]HPL96089.1 phosphatidate cytidylyltransferase [Smithellaceae bacterium]HQF84132.1 phosphatidate cytidylyltransferase [Smithellaceae bacterium]HQG80537.1 phosphatidate cytidylyltransferase [Smithellaceae bacterium]